jgi:hypothetical protein
MDVLRPPAHGLGFESGPFECPLVVCFEAVTGIEVGKAAFVVVIQLVLAVFKGDAVLVPSVSGTPIRPCLLRLEDQVDVDPGLI